MTISGSRRVGVRGVRVGDIVFGAFARVSGDAVAMRNLRRRWAAVLCGLATIGLLATLVTAGCGAAGVDAAARRFYGSEPASLDLARAVATGDSERIAGLVADGADPNAVGTDWITMAQWAIEAHRPDGLRALLEAGALPDRLGREGRAPLHDAARQSDPRYARILLDAGADPDVRVAQTRTTPLREACLASAPATFEALVAGGADVDAEDAAGDRALHICARADSGALVLRLLEQGADPRARNVGGNTFQDYYFSFSETLLSRTARRQHRQTAAWLDAHHVRLVPRAEAYRCTGAC